MPATGFDIVAPCKLVNDTFSPDFWYTLTTNVVKMLLFESETKSILSCAFEVLNTLGHGLLEKPYENALAVEFSLRGIPFLQQQPHHVIYKHTRVGIYVPDLIVFGKVIVETKVIDRITDHELGQSLNYLKITGHPVALILNFKRSTLEWKRVVSP